MKNKFITKIKYAKKYLLGKEFYTEQFDAAIEILDIMASDEPNSNFIILDSPTQSGKTSVMEMLYRILNFEETYKKYGIDHVIYMTADNGSGEGSLKQQTIRRFSQHWKNYPHYITIDFLKRSDFDKFNHVLSNTLIMVDESQYGWREITSKGQKFLQVEGINFCAIEEMQAKNMYILSVSATTQNERYGDNEMKMKHIVKLSAGKGYIGLKDFINEGILKPVSKDDFIDTYQKLDEFLLKQYKKLEKIRKDTGVAKCVIMRILDNKRKGFLTDSERFAQIVEDNGFSYKLITCKDSKIDYVALQSYIYYNCNTFNENDKKYTLIVIKYAFSYGITIAPDIKKLIGTCYDIRKDNYSTEATVQGMPGRMTGYGCSLEDLNGLEIFINETHYNGIKEDVINHNNEYSSPLKTCIRAAKTKCEKNEWNGDIFNIDIWNNENRKPLVFKGKIVDDFFKKHKEWDISKLFQKEEIKNTTRNSFFKEIALTFMKENGIFEKMNFSEDVCFDFRRKYKEKEENWANRMCGGEPLLTNRARSTWRTEENADNNAICWGAVIDLLEADEKTFKGISIIIPYGTIGYAKKVEKQDTKATKMKKYSGYDTSINKSIIKTPKVIVQ